MRIIVAGDTVKIIVRLTLDDEPVVVDLASDVMLQLRRGNDAIGPEITCLSSTEGADWPNGVVVGVLDNDESGGLTETDRVVAQVTVTTSGEPLTWITPLSQSIHVKQRAT